MHTEVKSSCNLVPRPIPIFSIPIKFLACNTENLGMGLAMAIEQGYSRHDFIQWGEPCPPPPPPGRDTWKEVRNEKQ